LVRTDEFYIKKLKGIISFIYVNDDDTLELIYKDVIERIIPLIQYDRKANMSQAFLERRKILQSQEVRTKVIAIDESTALIVRPIYKEFPSGRTFRQIGKMLESKGVKSLMGKYRWSDTTMMGILKNEKYSGSAILQETFVEDFLTHSKKMNNGEVPKYYVKDSHPTIIPKEELEMPQLELKRRKELRYSYSSKNCFSSNLICADCGHLYGLKIWHLNNEKYKKLSGSATTSSIKRTRSNA